ncbi:MAG: HAD family phosphatase [Patescibacteria group bacterium]|nr:HAD family phosphatase [Patescibacteria group bacterium]
MPHFKAIFWDSDGTLVDTEFLYFQSSKMTLAEAGISLSENWYINETLKKGTSVFELARQAGKGESDIARLRHLRNTVYRKNLLSKVTILDGVVETLEGLYGKVLMAVVTSAIPDEFDLIMQKTGLRKYFDFVLTSGDVSRVKPDPEPYLTAWKMSGFKKEECLAVEDTERGVVAAKAAGLVCFACPQKLTRTNDFSAADRTIANVREILNYFPSLH